MIRVTIWNEFRHEKFDDVVKEVYPKGIHVALAEQLGTDAEFEIKTATLDEEENGLTDEVLESTDVLIWWGHMAHGEVLDSVVNKVHDRVLKGMGLIVLHSGHKAKIFMSLMGTTCNLNWRDVGEKERLWVVEPTHPIVQGVDSHIELEHEEMYGERFDVPVPDELVLLSWFKGGEVFRSGCCYTRGNGKVFYFRPGHEAYPTYYNPQVVKILKNAVKWAKPTVMLDELTCPMAQPLEEL